MCAIIKFKNSVKCSGDRSGELEKQRLTENCKDEIKLKAVVTAHAGETRHSAGGSYLAGAPEGGRGEKR